MALLAKVHEIEPGFACRTSTCFKGKCGSCLVRVNGQDVLGCVTLVHPGETVVVEPHSKFKQIRDVVVDFAEPSARKEAGK
jgi:succinate dehydrogenase/fumarate reductase-like Fe-S protein